MNCSHRLARTVIAHGPAAASPAVAVRRLAAAPRARTPAPVGRSAPYFEGGQLPLVRRLPHLGGFTNIWRVEFEGINVERLNIFPVGTEITPEVLMMAGMIKSDRLPVKILGDGELDRALSVKAQKFSAAARAKILAAGGSVEEIA